MEQRLVNVETDNFEENIRKYAHWKGDDHMLTRIGEIDFKAKEVKYHAVCRSKYQTEAQSTHYMKESREKENREGEPQPSYWQQERDVHTQAFDALACYIEETIIANSVVHLLTDVNDQYCALLHEIGGDNFKDATPSVQKLEEKILKRFPHRIRIEKGKTKRGNIIYNSKLTTEEALRKQHDQVTNIDKKIRDVAYILREAINDAKKTRLPENVTLQDVYRGEVDVPEVVSKFFTHLIGGPDSRRCNQPAKQQRIKFTQPGCCLCSNIRPKEAW